VRCGWAALSDRKCKPRTTGDAAANCRIHERADRRRWGVGARFVTRGSRVPRSTQAGSPGRQRGYAWHGDCSSQRP
jgi:hypothetical protein